MRPRNTLTCGSRFVRPVATVGAGFAWGAEEPPRVCPLPENAPVPPPPVEWVFKVDSRALKELGHKNKKKNTQEISKGHTARLPLEPDQPSKNPLRRQRLAWTAAMPL